MRVRNRLHITQIDHEYLCKVKIVMVFDVNDGRAMFQWDIHRKQLNKNSPYKKRLTKDNIHLTIINVQNNQLNSCMYVLIMFLFSYCLHFYYLNEKSWNFFHLIIFANPFSSQHNYNHKPEKLIKSTIKTLKILSVVLCSHSSRTTWRVFNVHSLL